jgi:hypothetical protein
MNSLFSIIYKWLIVPLSLVMVPLANYGFLITCYSIWQGNAELKGTALVLAGFSVGSIYAAGVTVAQYRRERKYYAEQRKSNSNGVF